MIGKTVVAKRSSLRSSGALLVGVAMACPVASAQADPVEDFYKGRQVAVIVSGSVGSTYDIGTRMIVKHMSRFIPGRPQFVVKLMTGAGHLLATNHLYNVAERDGSVIGSVGETIPIAQFLAPARVKFDAGKFHWIGNPAITNTTIITWHATKIRTLADAMKREVVIGATGVGSPSAQVPQILNNVLGTKFKIINGFTGTAIELAMERGEVDARGSVSLNRLKSIRREWIAAKKLNLLVQIGLKKDVDFAEVPMLAEFARNEVERRIFRFISSSSMIGRPIVAPPGVPADRIAALRRAFAMTMKDPDFLAEAAKLRLDIDPVYAEELQAVVQQIAKTSPADVAVIKAAHASGKTFNCQEVVKDLKLCAGNRRK
jgi:tripartite-type tricarboxylate transporter receptor subunit TctC